jgi:hypothetical protein
MKKFAALITLVTIIISLHAQLTNSVNYKAYFENKTMRVDYFHSGTATEEHFALDRIVNDGPWSGSMTQLTDNLNLGLYFLEIKDRETDQTIYSRGFASIFGEWQTTEEAGEIWGTYHESVRFPWPLKPVKLMISKRDSSNLFAKIWETEIDPASHIVIPAENMKKYNVLSVLENGAATNKVDVVILGDGYTADQMKKYHDDAERLTKSLFEVEPFKSHKNDFNVRAVDTPSEVSGVNKPHPGVFKRTPLSVSYGAFDSERYALAFDNRTIRDVAATVPYDFMFILINEQTYGGGGIYQLYSTVVVDNKFSDYIFVHEFGHHFAALADEYYTSDVSYQPAEIKVEPWEPNITALLDKENLKWKNLVAKSTPVPTPWEKEKHDKYSFEIQKERRELRAKNVPETEMEALFEREKKELTVLLDNMEYSGKVGAFEGGGYMQYGLYRPYADCIMFTRNKQQFCPVCRDAVSKVIEQYIK